VKSVTPLLVAWWIWLGLLAIWFIAAPFTHRTRAPESRRNRWQHGIPMLVGFLLIFQRHRHFLICGPLYGTSWDDWIVYPGIFTTFVGCLFAIWARMHLGRYWSGLVVLKEGHKLITTGPYRFVRHPLYTGWLTGMLGSAVTAGTGDAFLGLVVVTVAIIIKLRREEKLLATEFGDEYRQFQQSVPATLIPFVY
jgi:protein-S-isoprenylcysteine O-methyltransferase Ste14